MPRKKKIKEAYIELVPMSKEEFEKEYPSLSSEEISNAKTLQEHLDNEPLIHSIQYTGTNAKEIMEFCGAYHMVCHTTMTNFLIKDLNRDFNYVLPVKPGQYIIKQDNQFRVIDND